MIPQEIIELLTHTVSIEQQLLCKFVKDSNNSFKDRLHVWLNTPECFCTKYEWLYHPSLYEAQYGKISWYDDFCCEKLETINLRDIYTSIIENDDIVRANLFALDCMNDGYHIFKYDW